MPRRTGNRRSTGRTRPKHRRAWVGYADERLLDVRLRDLDLTIGRTPVARCVRRLYAELESRGLRFRPPVWLSTEWFSPDGVPGVALPF